MSEKTSDSTQRKIFNSKLAILQPPPPRYKGEWPKKPPYWKIHGTLAAANYWKIALGTSAASVVIGAITFYVQPKLNAGLFDRYITPEIFYSPEEKEKWYEEQKIIRGGALDSQYERSGTFTETTKEYRERLDGLEAAISQAKTFHAAPFKAG